ncbi:MAG: PIG-L family deacetylase, partial [Aquificaceae bacterium]|nr:PIG-L family deacetylase [Aquificaceae bacterium]
MNILLVFAHPDDEVLACGGTVAKLAKEGFDIYTTILGEGITSRDSKRNPELRKEELHKLKEDALRANKLLGVKEVFFFDFPDNRFDGIELVEIVKTVERIVKETKPQIIFTHYWNDLNVDHRITCRAVITATRPQPGMFVGEIYACEVLSSTEWNYPLSFQPDTYFLLSEEHIKSKIQAMKCYSSEIRSYPHPRSPEGIEYLA